MLEKLVCGGTLLSGSPLGSVVVSWACQSARYALEILPLPQVKDTCACTTVTITGTFGDACLHDLCFATAL